MKQLCGALVYVVLCWYGPAELLIWPLCGVGLVLVLARFWCDTAVVGGAGPGVVTGGVVLVFLLARLWCVVTQLWWVVLWCGVVLVWPC